MQATEPTSPQLLFSDERLGEILLKRGTVGTDALAQALATQAERGGRLGELLVAQKSITEDDLLRALAEQLDLKLIDKIDDKAIPDELITKVPINFAKQYRLVPLGLAEDGTVRVACADPLQVGAIDDLAVLLNSPVEMGLAPVNVIIDAINKAYDRGSAHAAAAMDQLADEDLDSFAQDIEEAVDLLDAEDEAPIIRLVNSLISQAIKEHASDIHVEPGERDLVVRFRIDGILYEKIRPPKKLQASIVHPGVSSLG
jgi:general secretion pathway protein E